MYKRLVGRIAIVILLVGVLAGAIPAQAADDPTYITTTPIGPPDADPHANPRTDGTTVVWHAHGEDTDGVSRTPQRDIYAANLIDRQVVPIATGPTDQFSPVIDDGVVVWSDVIWDGHSGLGSFTIRGKDLNTGQPLEIGTSLGALWWNVSPSISGRWVVWRSSIGDSTTIHARDIATMSAPTAVHRSGNGKEVFVNRPQVESGLVTWFESNIQPWKTGPDTGWWRVYVCMIEDCNPLVAVEGDAESLPSFSYSVGEGFILYKTQDTGLMMRDLISWDLISVDESTGVLPQAIDGRYVVWEDKSYNLRGYDRSTASTFPISIDTGVNRGADLSHEMLVWQRGTGPVEIHAAPIASLLPNTRQPDPGATSPNWFYFPETGHYLSAGFKQFWEQSGGLPVFGYPLTEEFNEHGLTVQYLERQRFEYHPEHAGTPYETELGLLGSEDANRRSLLSNAAFQPLPGNTPSDGKCTFVAETGHKLCGVFRSYWQRHGLEFNDPGISYRESLALFGYPISEEFIHPETGLVTQYFERARFEHHLAIPGPPQVLLGRLGADKIEQRGW